MNDAKGRDPAVALEKGGRRQAWEERICAQAYEYSNGWMFRNQEFESLMVVVITHSCSLFS